MTVPMTHDVWDSISYLESLFPRWEPTQSERALLAERLQHFDQRKVRKAIEDDRVYAGRFTSPNIEKIIARCGRGEANASADPRYSWQVRRDRLPEHEQRAFDGYDRLLNVADAEQKAKILRRFSDVWELARLDWLGLGDQTQLLDRWLPTLVKRLCDAIDAPPVSDAKQKVMGRMVDNLARAFKGVPSKRYTVAELESMLDASVGATR